MSKRKERCETCRYLDTRIDENGNTDYHGYCYRYPPVLRPGHVSGQDRPGERPADWAMPVVSLQDDWCGEWRAKDATAVELQESWIRFRTMLSTRARNILNRMEVGSWSVFDKITEDELKEEKGCGDSVIEELRLKAALARKPPEDSAR